MESSVSSSWVSPTTRFPPTKSIIISDPKVQNPQARSQYLRSLKPHRLEVSPNAVSDINVERRTTTNSMEEIVSLPYHVKKITSTSNPFVKHCLKLRHSSSYRHSHGSVLLVGSTPIREIFKFQESMQERPTTIDCLLLHEEVEIPKHLDDQSIRVVHVSSVVMKKLSGVQSPESIEAIALMRIPSTFRTLEASHQSEDNCRWFPFTHRILVLDGIQDPGNLGTLLRSAMTFVWVVSFFYPAVVTHLTIKQFEPAEALPFSFLLYAAIGLI